MAPMASTMADAEGGEALLVQAAERERAYDWLGAAALYEKARGLASEQDLPTIGDNLEREAYALHRAAFQAESIEEFRKGIDRAKAKCLEAKEVYSRASEPVRIPRMLRCDAMVAYLGSWLAPEPGEKARLAEEAERLEGEALSGFKELGEGLEYARTYISFGWPWLLVIYDWSPERRLRWLADRLEHGEKAISSIPPPVDPERLSRIYVRTALWIAWLDTAFPTPEGGKGRHEKVLGYWERAKQLSEAAAFTELCLTAGFWGDGTDESLGNLGRALECAKKTRDKLLLGCALGSLAYHTAWKTDGRDDPEEGQALLDRALEYAKESDRCFSLLAAVSLWPFPLWPAAPDASYCLMKALLQTNLERKKELLRRALEAAPIALERAMSTGFPEVIFFARRNYASILEWLARLEPERGQRERLLNEALGHAAEHARLVDQVDPSLYWARGEAQISLGSIKAELSAFANDPDVRGGMLQEAIRHMETGLGFYLLHMPIFAERGELVGYADIGRSQAEYGDLLTLLHGVTGDREALGKAADAYGKAAESFRAVNLPSRTAECRWKAGQVLAALGERLRAAECFDQASQDYVEAAGRVPHLKEFYGDYSTYMQAWSAIETAKQHHAKEAYGRAKECYEKAAELLRSSRRWNHLATNFEAWAQIEDAEELSRAEQGKAAMDAFEQAIHLFDESKRALREASDSIEDSDQREMASSLATAAGSRQEYCRARIALEEARQLERSGDHGSAAESYGKAINAFERIAQTLESEPDRREVRLLLTLARAWERMAKAEAEASPSLYGAASRFFEEAKELSPNEGTRMLALGHSRFCLALEAGAKFADSGEAGLHTAAVQQLEAAAKYYLKAGIRSASEHAKASKLLFDAYAHMDKANKDEDYEKKAKLYALAEKGLEAAASSYERSGHLAKREQVQGLLEKVKEEKGLALSFVEILQAPSIVSSARGFSAPTPTVEKAVGLERFEHADVQTTLIARKKELAVDEYLEIEIELVNAGQGPARLIKLERAIPEGFELAEKPEAYRVEDSYLNLKGKRLDPLGTEEVRLVLKPKLRGRFALEPRIIYVDEEGKYKSHEPQPIPITVKELGISGWLKGPRKNP